MNIYDKKIIEVAAEDAIVYELIREDLNSTGGQILDFLLERGLAFISALKDLKKRDAYYLSMNGQKSELVRIQRDLNISYQDVTHVIQASADKGYFSFEGKKYKLYRKIK